MEGNGQRTPVNRFERRKEETRRKIIKVAMALFRARGYDAVTVEQIAEEADIAKATLYNHFPVKEAIIIASVREDSQGIVPEIEKLLCSQPNTAARLKAYLEVLLDWVKGYGQLAEVYMNHRMQNLLPALNDPEQRNGSRIFVDKILEQGREEGEIRRDIPLDLLIQQFDLFRALLVNELWRDSENFNVDQQTAVIIDLFLRGAQGNKGLA